MKKRTYELELTEPYKTIYKRLFKKIINNGINDENHLYNIITKLVELSTTSVKNLRYFYELSFEDKKIVFSVYRSDDYDKEFLENVEWNIDYKKLIGKPITLEVWEDFKKSVLSEKHCYSFTLYIKQHFLKIIEEIFDNNK